MGYFSLEKEENFDFEQLHGYDFGHKFSLLSHLYNMLNFCSVNVFAEFIIPHILLIYGL